MSVAAVGARLKHWFGAGSGLRGVMARAASGLVAMRLIHSGLRYLLAITIARLVGADGFGVYAFANSWLTLSAVLGTFGLNTVVEREVASAREHADWSRVAGVVLFTLAIVIIFGLVIVASSMALSFVVIDEAKDELRHGLWIALLGLPLMLAYRQFNAVQLGFRRVIEGNIPSMVLMPAFMFAALGVAVLLVAEVDTLMVMWCLLASIVATCVASASFMGRTLWRDGGLASPIVEGRRWLVSGGFVSALGVLVLLNTNVDILMLGTMKGESAAGYYTAATRGAEFVTMALVTFEMPLRPMIVSLIERGEAVRLRRIVTKVARAATVLGVCVGGTLLAFGDWYLWLFGPEFQTANLALAILVGAQFLNVACGPVVALLVMSGHERTAAACVVPSLIMNVVLNLLLIPSFGIEGAAIATGTSVVIWNAGMVFFVRMRLGIDSTFLGRHL